MANRYIFHHRTSVAKSRRIVRSLFLDLNIAQIAMLTDISHVSANRCLVALRQRIAACCEMTTSINGDVEVDKIRFGARRMKGKRGCEPFGKIAVHWRAMLKMMIHSDNWERHGRLVYMGYHSSITKLS